MDSKNAIEFNQENGIRIGKKQQEIIVYFALLIDFNFNTWQNFADLSISTSNFLTK